MPGPLPATVEGSDVCTCAVVAGEERMVAEEGLTRPVDAGAVLGSVEPEDKNVVAAAAVAFNVVGVVTAP